MQIQVCSFYKPLYEKINDFRSWRDPSEPFFTKGPLKLASQGLILGPFGDPWESLRGPSA